MKNKMNEAASQNAQTTEIQAKSPIGSFEKNLTWWVLGCIVTGIALGKAFPDFFQKVGELKISEVNFPVAMLIWLMIVPMLLKIDFGAMKEVLAHTRGIGVTLFINWIVKPLSMALLAWIFIRHFFSGLLPAEQLDSYVAGLILLAAAPCTAMVFVWSNLCGGEPKFTLSQVAINDAIMLFAFAPIVALLLGLSSISVPWNTLFLSVVLFIVVPVLISQILRKVLLSKSKNALEVTLKRLHPISLSALLATLVLLFGFQGQQILAQPIIIGLLAVPIIIQTYFNSMLAYWLNKKLKVAHCVAGPSALIGASNFFELAVATAIALFGFNSGAALATVVGVLIEVPVMLSVVAIVNRSRAWYEAK
jgi:arsenite transporter